MPWKCDRCDAIFEMEEIPKKCPKCGTEDSTFSLVEYELN